MKWFLLGTGLGLAAAGVIFAPQEGSKSRSDLSGRISDWLGRDRQHGDAEKTNSAQERNKTSDARSQVNEPHSSPELSIRQQLEEEDEAVAEVLNTAKRDELMSVKGIGRATAKRIIKNRPYHNEEEVLEEGVLKEELLEKVKEELVDKDQGAA